MRDLTINESAGNMVGTNSGSSPERVEVVNLNSMTPGATHHLDEHTRRLVERRERVMGPAYRLSYQVPFQPVRALGTKIYDIHGDEYLDAYNNVVSIGHNHPTVVDAVTRQMSLINTNTRYLQEDIVNYAEDLVSTNDPELNSVMFTCTGSEANDLAMRIAREYTGGTGIIVTDYAYHGCTRDVASWSPSSGQKNALASDVRAVAPPDYFRNPDDLADRFAADVLAQINDLKRYGVRLAALVVDSTFSSDGIFPDADVLAPAAAIVRTHGGVVITDEVQAGFGRTGDAMWGYQRCGFTPDLTTMGKPMGNGLPIGGVTVRKELLDYFGNSVAYFNTFGGENLPVAAAQAVLNVLRDENLIANAKDKGTQLRAGLREIVTRHGVPVDIRGAGMYIGAEFVTDLDSKTPDAAASLAVVEGLKQRKVITSSAGTYGNVIKIRPPIVFSQSDTDRFLTEFEYVVSRLPSANGVGANGAIGGGPGVGQGVSRVDLRQIIAEELRGLIGGSGG